MCVTKKKLRDYENNMKNSYDQKCTEYDEFLEYTILFLPYNMVIYSTSVNFTQ